MQLINLVFFSFLAVLVWQMPGRAELIDRHLEARQQSQLEFLPLGAEPRFFPQLVYSGQTERLERLIFELKAPRLKEPLDVMWRPQTADVTAGPVSGPGQIIWRLKGAASYDPRAIVAVFSGGFVDGQAEGQGRFWHRDGSILEGMWSRGRLKGIGATQSPDGTTYKGAFNEGLRHGRGVLVEPTGTIYDGDFRAGHLQGRAHVTPFGRPSYTALWREGVEVPGSRVPAPQEPRGSQIHLAQSTSLPDAQISVGVDPTPPPNWYGSFEPYYRMESRGSTLSVFPADARLRNTWTKDGPIKVTYGESDLDPAFHVSPGFNLGFENTGNRNLQVIGGYLSVARSVSHLRPVLDVFTSPDCGEPNITSFTFRNYGWSQPIEAQLNVEFRNASGQPVLQGYSAVNNGWPVAQVDLHQYLESNGVRLSQIQTSSAQLCQANSVQYCYDQLRAYGLFGNLANAIYIKESGFYAPMSAALQYRWRRADGSVGTGVARFEMPIKVGNLPSNVECGEGGSVEERFPNPFWLDLDRVNYQVTFGVNASIPPGVKRNWSFQIEAEKASFHTFQVVLILADGREIASRPIELEYLRPRSPYENY